MRKDFRNCEDDGSKHLFLVGTAVVFLFIVFLPLLFIWGSSNSSSSIDDLRPKLLDTNSIGCSKYRYKGSEYWVCPKELNINSIEVTYRNGRTLITELDPVLQQ